MAFSRCLSEGSIDLLASEAQQENSWWRCVLDDPKLFIGIRKDRVDVYWLGQCIFQARNDSGKLKVTTHPKYLLDPGLKGAISISDGSFNVAALSANALIRKFEGKSTLERMKKAAAYYAGDEKVGCHQAAEANPSVIDVEVALLGADSEDVFKTTQSRIDFAALDAHGENVNLVFWEAKVFSNKELRSNKAEAPVVAQMTRYVDLLTAQRTAVEASYRSLARNLVAFRDRMGWARPLSPLVSKVAASPELLTMHDTPSIRLLVFGFDKDQEKGAVWKGHLEKLEAGKPKFIGDAKNARL